MAESYGWAGKILRVDLTTGEITTQDDAKYHKYIGGMGMAYRIMYEEAPMDLDPYDEKAQVIFGVGPLTGAGVPCSGRRTSPSAPPGPRAAPSSTPTWAATSAPC